MEITKRRTMEKDCFQNLKHFIQKNVELSKFSNLVLTDQFLLHFVRVSKNDLKKACKTMENYFRVRQIEEYKDLFQSIRPSMAIFDNGVIRIIRKRDHLNRMIFVNQIGNWNPDLVPFDEILKVALLYAEEVLNFQGVNEAGIIIVVDLKGLSIRHIKAVGPADARKLVQIFWSSFPLKYKEAHFVNEMYLFKALFKVVFYPFLPKKFRDRMQFHGSDLKSLHKFVSPTNLPQSLGGTQVDKNAFMEDSVKEKILQKEEYYENFARMLK